MMLQHAMALVSSGEVRAVHYDSCIVLTNQSLDELQKQELMIVKLFRMQLTVYAGRHSTHLKPGVGA